MAMNVHASFMFLYVDKGCCNGKLKTGAEQETCFLFLELGNCHRIGCNRLSCIKTKQGLQLFFVFLVHILFLMTPQSLCKKGESIFVNLNALRTYSSFVG